MVACSIMPASAASVVLVSTELMSGTVVPVPLPVPVPGAVPTATPTPGCIIPSMMLDLAIIVLPSGVILAPELLATMFSNKANITCHCSDPPVQHKLAMTFLSAPQFMNDVQ